MIYRDGMKKNWHKKRLTISREGADEKFETFPQKSLRLIIVSVLLSFVEKSRLWFFFKKYNKKTSFYVPRLRFCSYQWRKTSHYAFTCPVKVRLLSEGKVLYNCVRTLHRDQLWQCKPVQMMKKIVGSPTAASAGPQFFESQCSAPGDLSNLSSDLQIITCPTVPLKTKGNADFTFFHFRV